MAGIKMTTSKTKAANFAIARARWEGEPRCSYSDLTDFLGISKQAIAKRAAKDGWHKKVDLKAIAQKAHAAADRKQAKDAATRSEERAPLDDGLKPVVPVVPGKIQDSKNASPEMLAQAVEDVAVDARAVILTRHRNEWPAIRNQTYKALKTNTLEDARLAKLAAETIKLVQDGERKAWGLDAGDETPTTIIIERKDGVRVVR